MGKRWSDEKLGRRSIPGTDYADIRDPANGAKVARCAVCGVPETRELVGLWQGSKVRLRVCGACIAHANRPDPRDTDPLNVAA